MDLLILDSNKRAEILDLLVKLFHILLAVPKITGTASRKYYLTYV